MKYIKENELFYNAKMIDGTSFDDLIELFEQLNDKKLVSVLEEERKNGRNDWPVLGMWRAFIASIYYNHRSIKSFVDELNRNPRLLNVCGLRQKAHRSGKFYKVCNAPSGAAFSRFLSNLMKHTTELKQVFNANVNYFYKKLSNFGEELMADGKALQSVAHKNSSKCKDRRAEHDGEFCKKEYIGQGSNGEVVVSTKKWFGFRMHLIADANYELPISYTLTPAARGEREEVLKMLSELDANKINKAKTIACDKGYDGSEFMKKIEGYGIDPIIDIRNQWKDEETRQYKDTSLVYNYKGDVFYYVDAHQRIELRFAGYETRTDSLKYSYREGKKVHVFRIKRSENPRIFTRIARNSKKWKKLYNKRSGVERINGRLDRDYGFENHFIRGHKKMEMFLLASFIVMQSKAKIKLEEKQKTKFKAAA